jgi:hypothetical protein
MKIAALAMPAFFFGNPQARPDSLRITDYNAYYGIATVSGDSVPWIVLRSFATDGNRTFFCVNSATLATGILSSESLRISTSSLQEILTRISGCAYEKALSIALANEFPLQDAGITHFIPSRKGIDLTIDLCPSHKPLDRRLFFDLIAALGAVQKPVPLAIAITGRWMNDHASDLHWLVGLAVQNQIAIDWINHTYNHFVGKALPLRENFLLEKGVDAQTEIVRNEICMIERGLLPSIFFRFPGLVSDTSVFRQVIDLGLIPIGSDAWLAKGQSPRDGSIVLVHANGNDPLGVNRFIELLARERAGIQSKSWILYDLRESVAEETDKQNTALPVAPETSKKRREQ